MKHFKKILIAVVLVLTVSITIAAVTNPQRVGLFVSSDGTGNPGTWLAVSGGGQAFTGSVQPVGMFTSIDGTGNPGTWAAATSTSFASAAAPATLQYMGDGSNGAYSCPSGTCTLYANQGEYWFSSFNVASGATVALNNSVGGWFVMRVNGPCTIAGTLSGSASSGSTGQTINVDNFGPGGGGGGGGTAAGTQPTAPNYGGTSGAGGTAGGGAGQPGGAINVGFAHTWISAMGFTNYPVNSVGGNFYYGGGPGGQGGSSGGAGGAGGISFTLVCASLTFTGTIDASGQNGVNASANSTGGGGGGGGGILALRSPRVITNTGTIKVNGGAGGTCGAFTGCGAGGAGAAGISYVYTQ